MIRNIINTTCVVCAITIAACQLSAQDKPSQPKSGTSKQHQVESTAKPVFGSIKSDSDEVKKALDAKKLDDAKKLIGKSGAFKGTVEKVYAPKSGKLVVLDFDKDFKTALTAVLKSENFSKLPDLKSLEGKKVLVTGIFTDYKGAPQIELKAPDQIKLVK